MSVRVSNKLFRLSLCVVLLATSIIPLFRGQSAYAAQITARSLTLMAGATDGGSKPSGVVKHLFGFTIPTGGNVGSIKFEYCTIAVGTCTMPTGLLTTSATLDNETGATGFTMVNTTNGSPYLTRTAANVTASTAVTYRLATITNPSATNQAFFVRISTYVSTNTSGTAVDNGAVTASTATQIVLTGIMPESIIFCTGATVSLNGSIPDCSTATSGVIDFNQLFSPSDTATATSQMAASTNSLTGYSITVNGTTLTSGANNIPAMSSEVAGVRGTGQFGINLKLNTTGTSDPAVGAEIAPASNGTTLKGQPTANFDEADKFSFTSGASIANSASGGAGPTDGQVYTLSYITNVSGSQPAGTYTTTLTYICTATF
jgi:hypothetical protein